MEKRLGLTAIERIEKAQDEEEDKGQEGEDHRQNGGELSLLPAFEHEEEDIQEKEGKGGEGNDQKEGEDDAKEDAHSRKFGQNGSTDKQGAYRQEGIDHRIK